MNRSLLACCLALAFSGGFASAENPSPIDTALDRSIGDPESLQGTWDLVSLNDQGQKRLDDGKYRVIIKGTEFRVIKDGKDDDRAQIKLDPSRSPKTIDLKISTKEVDLAAIYKLEGNTLTICWNDLKERPKAFPTKADEKVTVLILKRARPSEPKEKP